MESRTAEVLPSQPVSLELAVQLDAEDALKHLREEFHIPSKSDISRTALPSSAASDDAAAKDDDKAIYLVGNSLGLQPRRTQERIQQYLATWRTQGVQGHFKPLEGSPLPTWLDVDDRGAEMIAPIVGAQAGEVAVMQTLSANLHLLMAAFYTPDKAGRHKIILERKAFPSDHFVVESQLRHHGLRLEDSMVLLDPPHGEEILPTEYIQSVIEEHASSTALLLLPGIQYYTGQLFDIRGITAFARARGVLVLWDLAHAVGNVPLALHDWDVDAAAWCTYKYLNGGPGCIGGLFVHERHARVDDSEVNAAAGGPGGTEYRPRLSGWWGNDKATRFAMATVPGFRPASGAAGFQLSNPSVLDTTALCASLEVFARVGGMAPLRAKSRRLTAFLEAALRQRLAGEGDGSGAVARSWRLVTPADPEQRGAQLSIALAEGLLDDVVDGLGRRGVLVDERRPDVIRVAPAPLYNTFQDCWEFVDAFEGALLEALDAQRK